MENRSDCQNVAENDVGADKPKRRLSLSRFKDNILERVIDKLKKIVEEQEAAEMKKQDDAIEMEIQKIWNKFDADGDGTLDLEEAKTFIRMKAFNGLTLTEA